MSVIITNSVKVSVLSGSGITVTGPKPSGLTTASIFSTDNPKLSTETELAGISDRTFLGSASIDCTIASSIIPLYAAPIIGHTYITLIHFVLSSITGSGAVPSISIGLTGNYQEFIDGITYTTLFSSPYSIITPGQILPISNFNSIGSNSGVNYRYLSYGDILTAKISTASTYTKYTVLCNIFGFIQE